jgi:hypothetical protein
MDEDWVEKTSFILDASHFSHAIMTMKKRSSLENFCTPGVKIQRQ